MYRFPVGGGCDDESMYSACGQIEIAVNKV